MSPNFSSLLYNACGKGLVTRTEYVLMAERRGFTLGKGKQEPAGAGPILPSPRRAGEHPSPR